VTLTVNDRARAVGMFRFIEVRLMEIAAAWTPTTPEMEVKVMFGRHIFDFAQHADSLGKRTFELRQPAHYTLRPEDDFASKLEALAKRSTSADRIAGMYDDVLPALERRYGDYVAATDPILDEPSLIIIHRILQDLARQRDQAKAVRAEIAA
jgi:hypothetical protein